MTLYDTEYVVYEYDARKLKGTVIRTLNCRIQTTIAANGGHNLISIHRHKKIIANNIIMRVTVSSIGLAYFNVL